MKLSLRSEYALRALMVLGEHYSDDVLRIQYISQQQEIPQRFLEQILNDLKSGGFVESKRGVAGGYRLTEPPEDLSLAAVVRHIEGSLVGGGTGGETAPKRRAALNEAQRAIGSVMREVRDAVLGVLDRLTVADLCARAEKYRSQTQDAAGDYVI